MKNFFCTIGDLFESSFTIIELMGNTVNYLYIGIIFVFLVFWTKKMISHKKNNEEHAPL